jgi:hypothetical protein
MNRGRIITRTSLNELLLPQELATIDNRFCDESEFLFDTMGLTIWMFSAVAKRPAILHS